MATQQRISPFFSLANLQTWLILTSLFSCGPAKESPSPRTTKDTRIAQPNSSSQDATGRSPRLSVQKSGDSKIPEPIAAIGWMEPIKLKKFNLAPNPNLEGKTLRSIVESTQAGRDDGKLCSECHNETEAAGTYGLNVPKNTVLSIQNPWESMGTDVIRRWAGEEGWAERFAGNSTKPKALRTLMQAWIKGEFNTDLNLDSD